MIVYILYSKAIDRYYIGQTEDLAIRINMHIEKFFLKSFTARAIDWTLFLAIECSTRNQSVGIERHIKKMKTRKYIEDLKRYPEIIIKLKEKYQ